MQGTFLDTYKNLTYKSVMGQHWVSTYCQVKVFKVQTYKAKDGKIFQQAEMVLKSDDDIYNDIYGTLAVIRRILLEENLKESFSRGELMLGHVLSEFAHLIFSVICQALVPNPQI